MRHWIGAILLLTAMATSPSPAQPEPITPAGEALENVRLEATVLDTAGTRILVREGYGTVTLIDLSDPLNPDEIARYSPPSGAVLAGALDSSWVWLHVLGGTGTAATFAVDLSSPDNPVFYPPFSPGLEYIDLFVHSGLLFALSEETASGIYDIVPDPTNPALVATLPPASRGAIHGNQLVLQGENLKLFDISNPTAPTLMDTHPTQGEGISMHGDYVYERGGENLRTFTLAGGHFELIHTTYAGSWFGPRNLGFRRVGSRLFAGARGEGDGEHPCYVFDLSDPAQPELAATPDLWPCAFAAGTSNATLISLFGRDDYTHSGAWMYAVDVSELTAPVAVDSLYQAGRLHRLAASDDIVVAGTSYNGHWTTRFEDGSPPTVVHASPGRTIDHLAARNDRLYSIERHDGGNTQLVVHDLSDPSDPTLLQTFDLPQVEDLDVTDSAVYVECAGQVHGTRVFGIEPDGTLTDLGELNSGEWAPRIQYLAAEGALLYRITYQPNQLRVYATLDPSNPTLLGSYNLPHGGLRPQANDGRLLLISNDALRIYRVADPESITPLATISQPFLDGTLAWDHLFTVAAGQGLQVWSLDGVPDMPPIVVAQVEDHGAARAAVSGNMAYTLSERDLRRWDLSGLLAQSSLHVVLNPWLPSQFVAPAGGMVWFDAELHNFMDEPVTAQVRLEVTAPAGATVVVLERQVVLGPGESILREWMGVTVPGWAPAGSYTCTAIALIDEEVVDSDGFWFRKLSSEGQAMLPESALPPPDAWGITVQHSPFPEHARGR